MTGRPQSDLLELFPLPANPAAGLVSSAWVVQRGGVPFLWLPAQPGLAALGLALYPAQRWLPRLACWTLRSLGRAGLPLPLPRQEYTVDRADPLLQYLTDLAGPNAAAVCRLAILAGNPHVEGRRYTLLVIGAAHRPVAVVKVGISGAARALVEREAGFLNVVPRETPGLPSVLGVFRSERVTALATKYCAGTSAPGGAEPALVAVGDVGRPDPHLRGAELPAWERLAGACRQEPAWARCAARLQDRRLHPVVYHGDLAPWNIKVSPREGVWTVLDWERGELAGLPAWDAYHYMMQVGLARTLGPAGLARSLERFQQSAGFRTYAQQADILGSERDLLVAYLLYRGRVIRPTEDRGATSALLAAWGDDRG